MKYRSEIDGLRALAVVPVILFHAGFELFSGGFVGVDVFFVISGYLITTILIEDIENNRFSLVNFYERRARRILPALFLVMLVCIPFAWMWMLPYQMIDFSHSLAAVSLFASNILFWYEDGYFAAASEEKPLLHTWSLAVEEQYYVLFPIFLLLAWRFGKNRVFWMIVVMAAISLLASEWGWRNRHMAAANLANFYLTPTRAWEIFSGSIAAFVVQKRGVKSNNALSLTGLAAIIYAVFAYDETTPFPSVYALVPVLGVVLLVLYADKETLAARLLSTKAFVGIGLISYSAYLWHQPLFAFARIRLLEQPSSGLMLALCFLSLLLAFASWKFVEQPFRNRKHFSRQFIFLSSTAMILGFTLVGVSGHLSNGYESRFPDEVAYILEAKTIRKPMRPACRRFSSKNPITHINNGSWYGNPENATLKVLYWGDSHVGAVPMELCRISNNLAIYRVVYPGCPPVLGLYRVRSSSECEKFNNRVFDFLQNTNFDIVVLSSRWRLYFTAQIFDNGLGASVGHRVFFDSNLSKKITRRERVIETTKEFVSQLSSSFNTSEIIVIGQIPEAGWNVPERVAKRFISNGSISDEYISRNHVEESTRVVEDTFSSLGLDNVHYVNPLDTFCTEQICRQNIGFNLLYWDSNHLTQSGAAMLATDVYTVIEKNRRLNK